LRRGGDVLSPLINLGWLALAVLAAWCLGRVWNAGAAAVAATAVVATTPVMVYASAGVRRERPRRDRAAARRRGARRPRRGVAAGGGARRARRGARGGDEADADRAGHRADCRPRRRLGPGARPARGAVWFGAVLATGGFWYLRNTVRAHNPFPRFELSIGSWTLLPSSTEVPPDCDTTSVADRLTDLDVVRDVFLPALASAFGPR